MTFKTFCVLGIFSLFFSGMQAQEKTNQWDENGNRNGPWEQYYPGTKQLRYEGTFLNGKEVGVFKFYCENCKKQPAVIKEFNPENELATVKYFSPEGKLLSEGTMEGKIRIGTWTYYQEDTAKIVLTEEYVNDELHGEKITYYPNGKITERTNYQQGKQQGEAVYYDENGSLIKRLNYKDGLLHGRAIFYTSSGLMMIDGNYNEDKEFGVWKYYSEGNLVQEIVIEEN